MRLATLRQPDGATTAAVLDGDTWAHLPYADVGSVLRAGAAAHDPPTAAGGTPTAHARYAPLIASPGALLGVGLNYEQHRLEMGRDRPEHPAVFAKVPRCLAGAHDDIPVPAEVRALDWEAELAVIIGSAVGVATAEQAAAAIAGYTVANDVTARDWQSHSTQWTLSKSIPSSCPLGPVLVTPDECDDAEDLTVTCAVNGQSKQRASTNDMLFRPAEVVAYVSRLVPLHPGDVILTGTPGGVGARDGDSLRVGDIVETGIAGLGQCRNLLVAGP